MCPCAAASGRRCRCRRLDCTQLAQRRSLHAPCMERAPLCCSAVRHRPRLPRAALKGWNTVPIVDGTGAVLGYPDQDPPDLLGYAPCTFCSPCPAYGTAWMRKPLAAERPTPPCRHALLAGRGTAPWWRASWLPRPTTPWGWRGWPSRCGCEARPCFEGFSSAAACLVWRAPGARKAVPRFDDASAAPDPPAALLTPLPPCLPPPLRASNRRRCSSAAFTTPRKMVGKRAATSAARNCASSAACRQGAAA